MEDFATLVTLLQHIPSVHVTDATDRLRDYAIDGMLPHLLVQPNTVEALSQVVAFTNQHDLSVLARGSGSRKNLGGLAEHIDILVETNQLDHLLEHEGPDLTCHVEAGMTLGALQKELARQGQRLS